MRTLVTFSAAVLTATLATGGAALADPGPAVSLDGARPVAADRSATPLPSALKAGSSVVVGSAGSASPVTCGVLSAVQRTSVAPQASYVIPSNGVVTSWSYAANAVAGSLRPFVVTGAETSPGHRTVAAKGELQTAVPNTLNTFPTRFSVQAGQLLGVQTATGNMNCGQAAPASNVIEISNSDPGASADYNVFGALTGYVLNISVVLESDVDGDGFGDATQDACPQSAATQAACPAPETTVKKPKLLASGKVKITFGSSVPGSTFTCAIDKKPAAPCRSPLKKRFSYGKHTIAVTAVSPLGIADPTPFVGKFKLVRR